jgi:hypothetical protein
MISFGFCGCADEDDEGPALSGNSISGTITYPEGNGNEHVIIFLFENPIPVTGPQESDVVASAFPVLNNGSVDYSLTDLSEDTYDLFVWIDVDDSNNGEFQPPTEGDKMLAEPHYVTIEVNGHESMDFSDFPVIWPDVEEYNIQNLTINVDGNPADWTIAPALEDSVGDDMGENSGTDIQAVYLAKDADEFFVRIDLADGNANSLLPVYYCLTCDDDALGEIGDLILFNHYTDSWHAQVDEFTDLEGHHEITIAIGQIGIGSGLLEMSYPLSALGNPISTYRYVSAWDDPDGPGFDDTETIKVIFP